MLRQGNRQSQTFQAKPEKSGPDDGGANFDLIARLYVFIEYLVFGPLLQRTRTQFVGLLGARRAALVLGDGDGRFVAALLEANHFVSVHAVDTSRAMLSLLTSRLAALAAGDGAGARSYRVEAHCESALTYAPDFMPDLIATHFFLDCLRQTEVDRLVRRLAARMAPGGIWVVSEFHIPDGWLRGPARLFVRFLYFAFRILTGLRTTHLPEYATIFVEAGLTRIAHRTRLFGVLTSELWRKGR